MLGGNLMKMMIWNCGKAFASKKKYEHIPSDIDIGIILECDYNGSKSMNKICKEKWLRQKEKMQAFSQYKYDNIQDGDLGIATFVYNKKFLLKKEDIIDDWLKQFLVFTINDVVRVLVYHGSDEGYNGIADLRYAVDKYKNILFSEIPVFICGDFNSNANNDDKRPFHTHAEFEMVMEKYGMKSYYDLQYGKCEKKIPTWRKNRMNVGGAENHIDYFYGKEDFFQKGKFTLGDNKWYRYSDHIPLFVELEEESILSVNYRMG